MSHSPDPVPGPVGPVGPPGFPGSPVRGRPVMKEKTPEPTKPSEMDGWTWRAPT